MKNYLIIISILFVSFFISSLVSDNTIMIDGVYAIYYSCFIIYTMQWVGFFPSFYFKTEHYYDLIGSFSFIATILFSFIISNNDFNLEIDKRNIFFLFAILFWTLRLGLFLFLRVKRDKKDVRFIHIKKSFSTFLMVWHLQGLWVFICCLPAIISMYSNTFVELGFFFYLGSILWIFGFLLETIADHQKYVFKKNKLNKDKFISKGLWSISRHPNYFGEIILWLGLYIVSFPVLTGLQHLAIISPLFVYILLTRISGINLLEEIGDKRWGSNIDYKNYKKNTPILFPKLF